MERQAALSDAALAALMAAAQRGDGASYEKLLRAVWPIVRAGVRRTGNLTASELEDVVQDVFMSLHSARATYDPRLPFLPWLFAILRHRALDHLRRRGRRASNEVSVAAYPETFRPEDANIGEKLGDEVVLRAAIAQLPKGQRAAIEHLKVKEMSLKEAAEATGMSIPALKVATHRAIKSLRVKLKRQGP